ncbi:hypothetical protein SRDD_02010 [Serratia sp. DD3]|nr:hypothetical protein SRDD_02010 [Serratia sp. DD3]
MITSPAVSRQSQIPVMVVRDRDGHVADFKLDKLDVVHVSAALEPLVDKEDFIIFLFNV